KGRTIRFGQSPDHCFGCRSQRRRRTPMHQYDTDFYRFVASFAARSAEQVVPLLTSLLPIDSVADFGCGEGAWLSVWRNAGVSVMGVDGPYVDRRRLMID